MHWGPAIYEHKAALTGRSPADVSRSASLLVEAMVKEFEVYRSDYLTVGIDVYNVEAEALGAVLSVPGVNACPDIAEPLFDSGGLPEVLERPNVPGSGRFGLMIEAALTVKEIIGRRASVRVAASGPFTLAAKLAGVEAMVMSLAMEDGGAERLLEFAADIAIDWCSCLRDRGLDAVVFDSMAAPPILSPGMYERFVLPLHRRIMNLLADRRQAERELVIGGNTVPIADSLKRTGATILLCDYAADAHAFASALGGYTGLKVRRNIDPSLLQRGIRNDEIETFVGDLGCFSDPIAGTGILPYDFEPGNLIGFMRRVDTAFG